MIEFRCADCETQIFVVVAEAAPADGLCMECRVIREAAPEDRAELARVFRKPTDEKRALYESMGTGELVELRAAFEIDRARSVMPYSAAFCDGRIALINEILAARCAVN